MKKIVIIGALGYLGTEISKIYSGESWRNKIIAIDNRFIAERVKQLKDWNIEFFQGEILDRKFLKGHLHDADIVHHLAGVTDVAYTKVEANSTLDKKIKSISIEGTKNVLDVIPNKCKIIFPSTHVVFEGLKKIKKNIIETEKTKPVLMYAKGKSINERDISKSNKKFIILRLGSVYGYSTDTMRINIMPNLFSKISSQNGTIKLFAGGKQLKSLINIKDVARCFKFMAENKKIEKEIFHLVNEQTSVKGVAELCKKINPKIKLIKTNDEVPNFGYTLSNRKLLNTGFKFLYSLEESMKEMIHNWSYQENKNNLEEIFKGKNEFIDKRGKISNYELPEAINLIGYIESKKNTVRANHFHPIQEQKCLLIKGQFISVYRNLLNKNSNIITHVVNEGDLIVTKPNVAHAMVFTKNSIFLNLVRGEREHQNYGITHTLPSVIVDEKIKNNLINYYKLKCRCCGASNLKRFISLGFQPLANNLSKKINENVKKYPLEVNFCNDCYNAQLSIAIDSKKMFANYNYLSSTSKSFRLHFENAAKKYIKKFRLNKNSYIIDVGANDGIGLMPFKIRGINNLLAIEPAKNLCKILKNKKINYINDFLNYKTTNKIKNNADLILASNVFAHCDDLKMLANCMIKLLSKKGVLIIEVQHLYRTLKDLTFDNIYHEHFNYWSLLSLDSFFKKLGARIFDVEEINTHGGSIRVFISKNPKNKIKKSVTDLIKKENKFGLKKFQTYKNFGNKVYEIKKKVKKNILKIKEKNNIIVGYGAPAKASTLINFFGISDDIDYVIDDNTLKNKKFIPGTNLQILNKPKLSNIKLIVIFAWNYFDEIKKKISSISSKIISIKDLEKL
tara:strand:+ start:165 stop:2705 length:2541 start_codon:yes stop_codon:yes gene_type:complete